jgi:phosphate-selective porin OprO/OprP
MTDRTCLKVAGCFAVTLSLCLAGSARADDASDKAQLEQRVRELERELGEVKASLRGGYFTANSDLEARVSELERLSADMSMAGMFKNGLRHEGQDGAFQYQFFGLIQNDWVWYADDGDTTDSDALGGDASLNPGVEFRRLRLGSNGKLYGNVKWWAEFELSGGDVSIADMWIELAGCAFGNVRVGHMKEPIGFDQLTGDRTLMFMERSFVNSLSPGRNTGVMLHGNFGDDMGLYQVGMFREANSAGDDLANSKDGEYNFSGRVSGKVWDDNDGQDWLHLGASARYSDYADDVAAVSVKPAFAQSPTFLGGTVMAEDGWQWGVEAAAALNQWTFLAEYARVNNEGGDLGSDVDVNAYSLEAGYWLTGENTKYDKSKGTWARHMPKQNFGDGDGMGAWRVSGRWDAIDLDDAGDAHQWTLGISWLLNPNTALHFNVARFAPDSPDVSYHNVTGIGARVEIDF